MVTLYHPGNVSLLFFPLPSTLLRAKADVATLISSSLLIDRAGRRTLLLYGAAVMIVCEFLVAIIGVTVGKVPEDLGDTSQPISLPAQRTMIVSGRGPFITYSARHADPRRPMFHSIGFRLHLRRRFRFYLGSHRYVPSLTPQRVETPSRSALTSSRSPRLSPSLGHHRRDLPSRYPRQGHVHVGRVQLVS